MFPIRPVPDNDVEKPSMFVFKDMDDYKVRGKNVDAEYMKMLAERKKSSKKAARESVNPVSMRSPAPPKPIAVVPIENIGKPVRHKSYGEGTIIGVAGSVIIVSFDSIGEKRLGYEVCIKNKLIEFISDGERSQDC